MSFVNLCHFGSPPISFSSSMISLSLNCVVFFSLFPIGIYCKVNFLSRELLSNLVPCCCNGYLGLVLTSKGGGTLYKLDSPSRTSCATARFTLLSLYSFDFLLHMSVKRIFTSIILLLCFYIQGLHVFYLNLHGLVCRWR